MLNNTEGYTNTLEYSTVSGLSPTSTPTSKTIAPMSLNTQNTKNDKFARDSLLLNGVYPLKNTNQVNFKDQWQKWWHYPSFEVGSYKQITNNIRYPNNPDDANCTPDEFCGALYHNAQIKSNVYEPIPPTDVCTDKVRIGYYNANNNMLPFVSNSPNILY
jgi:hypothetical protein